MSQYQEAAMSYAGSLSSAKSFVDNYDAGVYDKFEDKIRQAREKGTALIEASIAIDAAYSGIRAVAKSAKGAYNRITGEGDPEGEDILPESTDIIESIKGGVGDYVPSLSLEGGEGGIVSDTMTSLKGLAGTAQEGVSRLTDLKTSAEGALEEGKNAFTGAKSTADGVRGQFGEVQGEYEDAFNGLKSSIRVPELELRAPLPQSVQGPPAGAEIEMTDFASGAPVKSGGLLSVSKGDMAQTKTQQAIQEIDPEESTPAVESSDITGAIGDVAGEAVGEATSTALEVAGAVAGVALEAVPVVGGLIGLGIGLYDLFKKPKKPEIPATPMDIPIMKGETVIPSYDSVVDSHAQFSSF